MFFSELEATDAYILLEVLSKKNCVKKSFLRACLFVRNLNSFLLVIFQNFKFLQRPS